MPQNNAGRGPEAWQPGKLRRQRLTIWAGNQPAQETDLHCAPNPKGCQEGEIRPIGAHILFGKVQRYQPAKKQAACCGSKYKALPRKKVVLICTGSQGEARAAIARIAREEHPEIALNAGDRVIFSSWAIPGNEREVIDIQNMLIDRGVDVITQNQALVHTTGHPRREELKALYDLLKPDLLIPVHGEAAHLEAHAALGRQHGIETVVHARNGDLVRLFPETTQFPGEIPVGELYLDGNILCTPDESGVKGRRRLSFGGHIVVSLCVSANGEVRSGPDYVLEGLPEVPDEEESLSLLVKRVVNGTLKSIPPKRRSDAEMVQGALIRSLRGEVSAFWGRKPNVTVFVHRV